MALNPPAPSAWYSMSGSVSVPPLRVRSVAEWVKAQGTFAYTTALTACGLMYGEPEGVTAPKFTLAADRFSSISWPMLAVTLTAAFACLGGVAAKDRPAQMKNRAVRMQSAFLFKTLSPPFCSRMGPALSARALAGLHWAMAV